MASCTNRGACPRRSGSWRFVRQHDQRYGSYRGALDGLDHAGLGGRAGHCQLCDASATDAPMPGACRCARSSVVDGSPSYSCVIELCRSSASRSSIRHAAVNRQLDIGPRAEDTLLPAYRQFAWRVAHHQPRCVEDRGRPVPQALQHWAGRISGSIGLYASTSATSAMLFQVAEAARQRAIGAHAAGRLAGRSHAVRPATSQNPNRRA